MEPIVAVVKSDSLNQAFDILGCMSRLNTNERKLVVKVGIYNTVTGICSTVETLNQIINSFNKVDEIIVTESDSNAGPGNERLEVWRECYNDRAFPFNLSEDKYTKQSTIAGESVPLSHIFFEPNTFLSTHVLRRYRNSGLKDMMNMGTVVKNLLGLVPDRRKNRFHDKLPTALLDLYEAVGGIDISVLDATHVFLGEKNKEITVSPKLLIVGEDAFAVEAVGAYLVGLEYVDMPVLREASERGLGETNIDRIKVVGEMDAPREYILGAFNSINN